MKALNIWFPYLKWFNTALDKLPTEKIMIWKGAISDIGKSFIKGQIVSATVNVIKNKFWNNKNLTCFYFSIFLWCYHLSPKYKKKYNIDVRNIRETIECNVWLTQLVYPLSFFSVLYCCYAWTWISITFLSIELLSCWLRYQM
jgi:hypothetical protein